MRGLVATKPEWGDEKITIVYQEIGLLSYLTLLVGQFIVFYRFGWILTVLTVVIVWQPFRSDREDLI